MKNYTPLQLRELFHVEFLRWFGRKVKAECFALKGGTNLRLFFKSFRYSEDMDIDIYGISVSAVKDIVMAILKSQSLINTLKPFGVERISYPDMTKAKQTQTTQRFKIHIITQTGEDLFTKIEFSRRGFKGRVIVEPASEIVLRAYLLSPLPVPHYDMQSAVAQKIEALAARSVIQARDVFDLYLLSSQYEPSASKKVDIEDNIVKKACENILEIGFEQFRDTVVSYLSVEDQAAYNSVSLWDSIKLKVAHFIGEFKDA